MDKTEFLIPIDRPKKLFDQHLKLKNNYRIFFSGAFGIGKTFFLKKYFSNNKKIKSIHIFPINYQINTNEDIFELIKYDILLELISLGWINSETEINKSLAFQNYILNGNRLNKILENIPKLGKAFKTINEIVEFINKFKKYEKELSKTDFDYAKKFVSDIENTKGFAYESDIISNLIYQSISENKNDNLQICLIIDDLDRIDPEHIFRILNIFSSHFDNDVPTENKFNFDKIILVGDLENIRNIFHAKYGIETDFNGYIDKFYSHSCFNFDNKVAIHNIIDELLGYYIKNNDLSNTYYWTILNNYINPIINSLINSDSLNLRDLLRIQNSEFNWNNNFIFDYHDIKNVSNWEFTVINIIQFLEFLFGNNNYKLNEALEKCKNILGESIIDNNSLIGDIIILAGYDQIKKTFENLELNFKEINMHCTFKIERKNNLNIRSLFTVTDLIIKYNNDISEIVFEKDLFYLLRLAYKNYLNIVKR